MYRNLLRKAAKDGLMHFLKNVSSGAVEGAAAKGDEEKKET
jgi:hypothetical protein